jgi:hypothetical protein
VTVSVFKHVSHNNDIVTHQESDYEGDTDTPHMSRKHNVIKRKTKTQLWLISDLMVTHWTLGS